MPPIVVTIDGPAGPGKSTVALQVAERLGFQFLNTGAMYRAVAWHCLQHAVNLQDAFASTAVAANLSFQIVNHKMQIDGVDLSREFRDDTISQAASVIAAHPEIRSILVERQRQLADELSLVSEGRDQGTIVFPNATKKFFLTARPEVRAQRRYEDLSGHSEISYEQILKTQQERDLRDMTRSIAPLQPAPDAEVVDSSDLELDEVVNLLVQKVEQAQQTAN